MFQGDERRLLLLFFQGSSLKVANVTALRIEATKSSPMIEFNAEMRCMQITGESYPEDAAKFYNPVIQ